MSSTLGPLDVDALVFDAYGTLFDVHSVISLAEMLIPGHGPAVSQLWRAKQLEYTWLSTLMATTSSPRRDFARLSADALDYALARLGVDLGASDKSRLAEAYLTLAPFPDAASTLDALAPRPRWILSNGTLAMLHPLIASAGFANAIDGVLSVDRADVFKPSPRAYQLAVDALGVAPPRIGFVSSNCWDAIGAAAFGFKAFWVNRVNAPADRHGPAPDRIIATLTELPALLAVRR